ncbi:FmdB family zinc ribbon protein [Desulfurivibrio sp. D14AmB]|uniref:FmdB family zinc ribbon protein n=1 Tax=Desulfurivibrio sp. D14AmB TaxID=3374370 RepID=UPI00376F1B6B
MPIYEYECQACQKITETRQSINDAPLSTCPECGGQVSKIISQSSFALKGGGWYADGYSSAGAKSCATGGCPAAGTSSPCKGAATACGC